MFNVIVGVVWQTSIVLLPTALVTQQYSFLIGVATSVVITSIILKFTWWNKLDEMSKETLPIDFDEKVKLLPETNGQGVVSSNPEALVAYSK